MMTALKIYKPHELEYRTELVKLQREINFLQDFTDESPHHRSLVPVVGDLRTGNVDKEGVILFSLRPRQQVQEGGRRSIAPLS